MSITNKRDDALKLIDALLRDVLGIATASYATLESADEKLERWKKRAVKTISVSVSQEEGNDLDRISYDQIVTHPGKYIHDMHLKYKAFLDALKEDISKNPEMYFNDDDAENNTPEQNVSNPSPDTKKPSKIFIVFGHDELNALKLKEMLRDRWGIEAVFMKDRPNGFYALFDKFERVANECTHAIILTTPDDFVEKQTQPGVTQSYHQPRPNVFIELGWFAAKFGRDNLCIFHKKEAELPTDISGIGRAEFTNDVNDGLQEIEKELQQFGLI
jgi:predicted nucleotide-binding protein